MIELEVKDYCHDCDSFEAKIEDVEAIDRWGNTIITGKVIFCRYRKRCASMMRFLERKMKNAEQEDRCASGDVGLGAEVAARG